MMVEMPVIQTRWEKDEAKEREKKLKGREKEREREKRLAGDKQEVNRVNIMQSEEKRYIQLQTKNIHQ